MNKIFKFSLLFLVIFIFNFTAPVYMKAVDDTTSPTGTILINDGALYTNTREVTLTLSATDDISPVTEMKFNNGTGPYSEFEPYSTTKLWTLSESGDGLKTVRVKFKDNAGNETSTGISATITLDTVIPVITLNGPAIINLNAGEAYTDAGATALDNDIADLTSSITAVNPVDTNTAGTYTITYNVSDGAGNSATEVKRTVVVAAVELTETFIIRNGNSVLYSGSVPLPSSGTVSISDKNGIVHSVNTQSVLAVLKSIDESSDSFSISDLQYYDSFSSFYIKCILPSDSSELCDNWQYSIGNSSPFSSIDATILSGGETIGIYFGNSHQLVLSANKISTGESINATAQKYDYESDTWNPLTNVSIGVTLPNPDNQWSPIIVSTHPVDALGIANITITEANTYNLGITEDSYFPSYSVTVSPPPPPSGGGGSSGYIPPSFSSANALAYLKSVQSKDGSFGNSPLYTDWAAIAFGALNAKGNSFDSLLAYFNSNNSLSPLLTDNERRAMALLALGQNPHSFNGINYINAIASTFDGAQFGNADLINDDIFALIPLKNSGYTATDDIIIKDISFIISKQKTNGSWEESVDMTAAAIQTLKPFESITGVTEAIVKATIYLINEQKVGGGWDSVYSTSWAMQAMGALSATWTKDGKSGLDYLTGEQASANNNGSVLPTSATLQNSIWATSYAIVGASLKPWSAIMQSVQKPLAQGNPTSPIVNNKITAISKVKKSAETSKDLVPDEIIPGNPTSPIVNNKITAISKVKKSAETSKDLVSDEIIPKILPNALATSAINTLPAKNTFPAIPITLGILSGLVFLYAVSKFFIK